MNLQKPWVHYLTRPFGLFGASLWAVWYDSLQTKQLLGVVMPDCLVLEEYPGVMRRYAIKNQLEFFVEGVKNIVLNDPQRSKEILETGLKLNAEAEHILEKNNLNLYQAVDFTTNLTLYTTIFPYFCYTFLHETKQKDHTLLKMAEQLRALSYYPKIINQVVIPLGKKEMGENAECVTLSEIFSGSTAEAESRRKAHQLGKKFVYQRVEGKETVEMVDNVFPIIQQLEKIKLVDQVKGQTAWPGKVRGTIRLILGNHPHAHFKKGEILLAITTNPTLMPLLSRCSAVVTDEGGVACHAAIICREIQKPCIIGTKIATKVFKDGDLVEVDAIKGIVKKIS